MMSLANVHPGGRYIVVDDASGLVVCAVLDRLGGQGRLITICDVDSPPAYPIMTHMNFDEDNVTSIMSSLNWATADEDYSPVMPPIEPPSGVFKSDRQKFRLNKRKALAGNLFNTRDELFEGEFDGLIVASEYDPFSIVDKLTPYLAGSSSIVVQSPTVQVLAELQSKLRPLPQYLGPTVTEGWLRRYQVLPGRTHPMMTSSGSGGYLLHAIRIYDNPGAQSAMVPRRNKKKRTDVPEVSGEAANVSSSQPAS